MAWIARGARTAALTSPSSEELNGTRSRETGSGAGLTRLFSHFGPDEPGTPARLRQVSVQPQAISAGLRCVDPRCGTLLGADAEVCDECGGSALAPLVAAQALLLGDAGDRPVAFELHTERPNVLGRSSPGGGALDIDVARFRGSESVHRRHAQFDQRQGQWFVTHLGRNPIVLSRPEGTIVVQPGSSSPLRSGDWLQIGRIRLQLIVDPARGI